jgi:hypothetical protein
VQTLILNNQIHAAMGYCCARGQKLAEFQTKAEYDEVLKAAISLDK